MDTVVKEHLIPPHPPIPTRELPFLQFLRAVRTNALTMWTEAAYQEECWSAASSAAATCCSTRRKRSTTCWSTITPTTGARRRRSASCGRSSATACCSATGEDWQAAAPHHRAGLAPRTLPVLARHIVDRHARGSRRAQRADRASRSTCWPPCRTWRWTSPAARCSRWRRGSTARRCARMLTEYRPELRAAASARHGAAAIDPDVARSRAPAVPAPLDGADRRR